MRCPGCGAENAEQATVCASCGAGLEQAAPAKEKAALPAARARGKRLSRFAVVSLVAAAIAPSLQVLRDSAGGKWLPADPAQSFIIGMALDYGAMLLALLGIVLGLLAIAQVALRSWDLRGAALAAGGFVLAAAGVLGSMYSSLFGGRVGEVLEKTTGEGGHYDWRVTAVVVVAVVVIEVALVLAARPVPASSEA